MPNEQHLNVLSQRVETWNQWRVSNPNIKPDLTGAILSDVYLSGANLSSAILTDANLSGADLSYGDLSSANLSGADLSGADLSSTDLSYANLSGADLSGADLSGANLSGAILSSTILRGADLSGANLSDANLSGANLSDANLSGANLSGANLSGANLSGANLSDVYLSGANLSGAILSGAILSGADLSYGDLSSANLSGANLSGADLSSADLSDADLSGADLSGADLSGAILSSADLSGAILSGAILSGAILSGANLRAANLSGADLSGANLSSANLSSANLSGANLSSANLSGANLSSANLRAANLSGANLSGANLSSANLNGANLSSADLSSADLSDARLINTKVEDVNLKSADLGEAYIKNVKLIRVNLEGANLQSTYIEKVASEEVSLRNANLDGLDIKAKAQLLDNSLENIYHNIGSKLKRFDSDEEGVTVNTTLELAELINAIEKEVYDEKKTYFLSVSNNKIKKIIDIALNISSRREESRFPQFQFYVQRKRQHEKSEELNFIIKFKEPIDLNDISTIHRISAGIPQRPYAIVVRQEGEILKADGVIRIESNNESIIDLRDIATDHLYGLTLSIENPGSLNLLFYARLGVIVQLSLRHARIQVNYDASLNLFANETYKSLAKNLSNNESDILRLTQLIGGIWNYILKLAVEFNHGGQFIILSKKSLKDSVFLNYLDIKYFTEKEETSLGKYIQEIHELNNSPSREKIKELTHSQKLLDCARLIAKLSTIDGAVVLDDKLDLIGFGAMVKDIGEETDLDNYETPNITPHFQDIYKYINGMSDNEQLSSDIKNKNSKPWNRKRFGARHNSAFKFCALCAKHNDEHDAKYVLKPSPSVFVVSQDGDIRIFKEYGKSNDKKVGVCGPLRPLWLPFS